MAGMTTDLGGIRIVITGGAAGIGAATTAREVSRTVAPGASSRRLATSRGRGARSSAPIHASARSVRAMTYSQPDPAEETTANEPAEQPDTDADQLEENDEEQTALDVDAEDVPTGRETSDDTEGGGQR